MATIGSLAVNITANTNRFTAGLTHAKAALGGFVKTLGGLSSLIAGVGAAGFAMIANAAIEAGSKIQELTAKLNISAEAITALHFAADQLESSATAVDTALGKMSLTLGKASAGSDAAIGAFNAINLNFDKLLSLTVDQQFLAIVDAINQIPNPADRAAAAMGIFGKSYKDILPLIQAGTAAIVEQGQRAVEHGAVLTEQQAAALNEAGDAVKRFSASWDGFKTQMVAVFAPAITVAMDSIVGALKVLKAFWWGAQILILDGAVAITRAVQMLEEAFSWLPFVGDWLAKDAEAADGLAEAFSSMAAEKQAAIQGMATNTSGGGPLAKSAANVSGYATTAKDAKEAAKATAADKKQEEKETAQNTKIIAEQMKLLAEAAKLGSSVTAKDMDAVKVKVAGVR